MKFMLIDGSLLRNVRLNAVDKMVLSYVRGFESQGRECYATVEFMAVELGVPANYLNERINKLVGANLLARLGNSYVIARSWVDTCNFQ